MQLPADSGEAEQLLTRPFRPKSLRDLALAAGYRTGSDDLIRDFYIPCIDASHSYDRAVGYFRSTLYALVGVALTDFAKRNGRIRLVCSPHLYTEDLDALHQGEAARDNDANTALRASLQAVLDDPLDQPVARLLATLVALGVMELRLAFRPGAQGIFHDKIGIFTDSVGSRVSFLGSANETFSAWSPRQRQNPEYRPASPRRPSPAGHTLGASGRALHSSILAGTSLVCFPGRQGAALRAWDDARTRDFRELRLSCQLSAPERNAA